MKIRITLKLEHARQIEFVPKIDQQRSVVFHDWLQRRQGKVAFRALHLPALESLEGRLCLTIPAGIKQGLSNEGDRSHQ